MEFFRCPCPVTGTIFLDGKNLGDNRDKSGKLWTKQCNAGLHTITLQCPAGKTCSPKQVTLEIADTDPISPLEVPFTCV